MQTARVVVEVVAGLIPQQPMDEYTQRFIITSQEWAETEDAALLLATRNGQAVGYAQYLMLQPDSLNWVHVDWLWL